MNDKMMKMLMSKKKEGKDLSDTDKKSKLEALMGMKSMASDMMSDKLKGLKKVTVASNDPQGLKSGLDKAKEMIEGSPEEEMSEDPSEEKAEMPDEMKSDMDYKRDAVNSDEVDQVLEAANCHSPEEIEELISKLQAKKDEMIHKS